MSTDEENKIEVIDPTDPRYKDDEHFHQNRYDDNKSIIKFIHMDVHTRDVDVLLVALH